MVFEERRKENNNCNQDDDDDDDDHGIEHLRHNIMFLDKKQGWCHTIVTIVPQGATRIVKIKKKKEKSGKCKGLRGKVTRLRYVNDSESRKSWSFGYGEECNFFRPG